MTSKKSNGKRLISMKIMAERAKMYVAWVQFLMIGWLFIAQTEFNLPMTILLVVSFLAVLSLIDFKWILPAELNRMAEKNPVMMKVMRDVHDIKVKLNDIEDKSEVI
ncbi:MAG: hypothetical protein PVI03_04635 [Candidatus Thorarchaeota archaeon]|jgi:Tfp pilus assembly protein PilZ